MNNSKVMELLEEAGNATWFPIVVSNILNKGWFLLEINPLPSLKEVEKVIYDIDNNNMIHVNEGNLYHSVNCEEKKHWLPLQIRKNIKNLSDEKFYIAVYEGQPDFLNGQPIAIALRPTINYTVYPDHPHINPGGKLRCSKNTYINYLPDSLCYIKEPDNLGKNENDNKFLHAFDLIAIWLLRHQLWLETRNSNGKGVWIGPQDPPFKVKQLAYHLNPMDRCRCGSKEVYANCHMPQIISELEKCSITEAKQTIYKKKLGNMWRNMILIPEEQSLQHLRSVMRI